MHTDDSHETHVARGSERPPRLLLVDDCPDQRRLLQTWLRGRGYEVDATCDAYHALADLRELSPDVVLTDLRMPGIDGIELMQRLHSYDPALSVVLFTATSDIALAVSAIKRGAADFLTKPLELHQLCNVVAREVRRSRMRQRPIAASGDDGLALFGTSEAIRKLRDTLHQVASSRASVLITGETGTGKELVANALHRLSPRAQHPLVKINCAALPETLLESELFGHERGAFTGAIARQVGQFEHAHGGTLFLDEIGEMPLATQAKLLRFLQDHALQRVGSTQTIQVDVRVVAGTNRDLKSEVARGAFRQDLYYRLNVVGIAVPPLRARSEDIPRLAAHFLRRHDPAGELRRFSDEALERMQAYLWPGNVRELENVVQRAAVLSRADVIGPGALPDLAGAADLEPPIPGSNIADIERYAILKTLEHTGGCRTRAAAILGMSARKIQYKLHEYAKQMRPHDPPVDD